MPENIDAQKKTDGEALKTQATTFHQPSSGNREKMINQRRCTRPHDEYRAPGSPAFTTISKPTTIPVAHA